MQCPFLSTPRVSLYLKHLFLGCVVAVVLAFTGCTTVGTKNLDNVSAYLELKPGVSTKHDVYAKFGQPGDVTYQGAPSTWVYYHTHARVSGWSYVPYIGLLAGGVREENSVAKFHFDSAQKFKTAQNSKDSKYVNQWRGLVQGVYRISTDQKAQNVKQEMARIGRPFDEKFAKRLADRRE